MARDEFYQELNDQCVFDPFGRGRIWKNCILFSLMRNGENAVRLTLVYSLYPNEGNGSRFLDWLFPLAKRNGMQITGFAKRCGTRKEILTTPKLRTWYRRHGAAVGKNGHFIVIK